MSGGKAYFATSGSEANETMVKLAWVYHTVRGKPTKRKVIARDRAFHGSTIAAASMCGLEFMHREFGLPLPGFLHTSAALSLSRHAGRARTRRPMSSGWRSSSSSLILRESPDTIAAFIAEPIFAGGGIIVPPPGYFARIQEVLRKYDILCLGRRDRHRLRAYRQLVRARRRSAWQPDMMSLAKGLSSSYFPISAVVVKPEIYKAVHDFNAQGGNFGHGFTNSGHPVGVAVALEAIRSTRRWMSSRMSARWAHGCAAHFEAMARESRDRRRGPRRGPHARHRDRRRQGDAGAVRAGEAGGCTFDRIAYDNGLVSRCMGDTLGFSPPLIVTRHDVDEIADRCRRSLRALEALLLRTSAT